jgi:hypothetical protein
MVAAHRVQLVRPEVEHLAGRLDDRADGRVGQEGVLLPVVETPVRRQLGDRACLRLEEVGPVVVHQGRVVGETVLGDEPRRPPGRLPHGGAVTARPNADTLERGERPLEVLALLVLGEVDRAHVVVRVVADLMAGGRDPLDRLGVAVDGEPGDEEGRGEGVLLEEAKQARHADQRAVRLVRHRHRVLRMTETVSEDGRLRVDVERQHEHGRLATEPAHHGDSRAPDGRRSRGPPEPE